MSDSPKYLVHAAFRANGVVERNDVVGAVFGQTEGLLGDDLDLRDLQASSKVGRIDVSLDTEAGRTYGTLTIASGLDRVETAILAAALETIERVGPARAQVEVDSIEDAREAKRRDVVDRATELLADLEAASTTSRDLVEAVREQVRVADVTEYEGLPAGPRVGDSDAIVIVEGRADVVTLLRYGVRNAIAAEGTDVPDALADLTEERTATAFLDGDRGGELICRELAQVADLDYVAFAPEGMAVEDLDRAAAEAALRGKVPLDAVLDTPSPRAAYYDRPSAGASVETPDTPRVDDARGGDAVPDRASQAAEPATDEPDEATDSPAGDDTEADGMLATANGGPAAERAGATVEPREPAPGEPGSAGNEPEDTATGETVGSGTTEVSAMDGRSQEATAEPESGTASESGGGSSGEARASSAESTPETLAGHVAAVVGQGTESVRLLDDDLAVVETGPAADAVSLIEDAAPGPGIVVLDDTLTQAVLDVAAQRGVGQVVARQEGEFVKRPTAVRTRTADEF